MSAALQARDCLSDAHLRALTEASAISHKIVKARGYETVHAASRLRETGFADFQCETPGLLIPIFDGDASATLFQYRPDTPRLASGKPVKYETPKGARCSIDLLSLQINPAWASDTSTTLWITEGIKKVDSGLSRGLFMVGLLGVWNWRSNGSPVPAWNRISLSGRSVNIVFDSDSACNRHVRNAENRLAAFLKERGARVQIVRLKATGSDKVGLDDFFASGGQVGELVDLASPWAESKHPELILASEMGPEPALKWLVEGLLPSGDLAVLSAKPKVGKSTLARALCAAVTRGAEFLGRPVERGAAAYLGYEDQPSVVRSHFADLEADVYLPAFIGDPCDLGWLEDRIVDLDLTLLVLDTLFRAVRIKDGNSYAEVLSALKPLQELAMRTGCAVIATHHDRKGDGNDVGDSALGSQAIFGTAATLLSMRRHGAERTIQSVQRYGQDLEPTQIVLSDKGDVFIGKSVRQAKEEHELAIMIEFVRTNPGCERIELENGTGIPRNRIASLVDRAVEDGNIDRKSTPGRGRGYSLWPAGTW